MMTVTGLDGYLWANAWAPHKNVEPIKLATILRLIRSPLTFFPFVSFREPAYHVRSDGGKGAHDYRAAVIARRFDGPRGEPSACDLPPPQTPD